METHGVFLRLEGRRCVVIGDDDVAASKALGCQKAGAKVDFIGPALPPSLAAAVDAGAVRWIGRPYRAGDLSGAFLAYASVRDPDVVVGLTAEAKSAGVLLNVVDVPDACDFFAGAVVTRGPVSVVIGTGGRAPAVAGMVRERVEATLGEEVGVVAAVVGALRQALAGRPDRGAVLRRLARSRLVDHLRDGDVDGAERLIEEITGAPQSLAALGIIPGAS